MNTQVTTSTTQNVSHGSTGRVYAPVETPEADGGRSSDLAPEKRVQAADQTDRIEISDVGKALAALSDQTSDKPELQLSPDKLMEMASE